jgi:hypothetical protein
VREPKDAELSEEITNRLDHDDVLLWSPRWLENFREMSRQQLITSIRTV